MHQNILINVSLILHSCLHQIQVLYFELLKTQQLKFRSQINVALKKVFGNLSAGMLSQKFSEWVKSFIVKDEAYHFISTIKGTPAYWKKFLYEVLAMVKQLGLPTFFMTLSCADLHWNELISIAAILNKERMKEADVYNMDFFAFESSSSCTSLSIQSSDIF